MEGPGGDGDSPTDMEGGGRSFVASGKEVNIIAGNHTHVPRAVNTAADATSSSVSLTSKSIPSLNTSLIPKKTVQQYPDDDNTIPFAARTARPESSPHIASSALNLHSNQTDDVPDNDDHGMNDDDDDLDDTMREEDESESVIRETTMASTTTFATVNTPTAANKTHDSTSSAPSSPAIIVGGSIDDDDDDALAILDGCNEDTGQRTTFPIRTLPVILGRTHETDNEINFVGMGKDAKALSRQHVRIDYYYVDEDSPVMGEVLYKNGKFQYQESEIQEMDILNHEKESSSIGFFAITVLGKNRILVNRRRIEKGQTCRLRNEDAIRISSFCLYFLAPNEKPNLQTLEIDLSPSKASNKRRLSGMSSCSSSNIAPLTTVSQSKPTVSAMVKRNKTMQHEIESLSTETLLDMMTEAIEQDIWDRRHQLVGSTLSYRAVLEAAVAPCFENNYELSRTEIMDYIAEMPKFREFVEQMLTKVEAKSYQASVTKALIKAGFSRTANSGRYIKWIIPENLRYKSAKNKTSSMAPSSPNKQSDYNKLKKVHPEELHTRDRPQEDESGDLDDNIDDDDDDDNEDLVENDS